MMYVTKFTVHTKTAFSEVVENRCMKKGKYAVVIPLGIADVVGEFDTVAAFDKLARQNGYIKANEVKEAGNG